MIALFFGCLIAIIFAGIVLLESQNRGSRPFRAGLGPHGLLGWITGGNWTAKVGGVLLIIGIGSLLRYTFLHVDLPPTWKLGGGMTLSAMLFAAAHIVRTRFGRRELSMALAGAAFGVAYLTAYSAYALFDYLDGDAGLAILALVALAAGIYGVARNAISLSTLAMFGAFLAPAFALERPGVASVYGYYLALSQLTLVMVALRGWRTVIHLSFLFTLVAGVFFAWTSEFYQPQYYDLMRPLLLALIATHVAMPLLQQRSPLSQWMARFDLVYFIALPTVGAWLLAAVAPSIHDRSTSLVILGAIWLLGAILIRAFALKGATRHGLVGVLLAILGLWLRIPDWPWLLIGQAISVLALLGAQQLRWPRTQLNVALTATLAFSTLFAATSLNEAVVGSPFANPVVIERLIACGLVAVAWRAARGVEHDVAPFLGWLATIGAVNTAVAELYRWDIASWQIILHIVCIVAAFVHWGTALRRAVSTAWSFVLTTAVLVTALFATVGANSEFATAMSVAAPLALLAIGLRSTRHESNRTNGDRFLAILFVPVATWIWARQMDAYGIENREQFCLALAIFASIVSTSLVQALPSRVDGWAEVVRPLFATAIFAILALFSLFHIERGMWPILMEALGVAALWQLSLGPQRSGAYFGLSALATALTVQAMQLRALGPPGTLTVFDVFDLRWPAVLSFFWASLGTGLTIAARRVQSRALWSIGATALAACAVKIVVFDFGSLGELANILSVIAAGLMFLLVAWLAPLPPKSKAFTTQSVATQ